MKKKTDIGMSKNADSTCLLRDVATAERRKCQCNRLGDTGAGVLCLGLCCVGFVFFFFILLPSKNENGEVRGAAAKTTTRKNIVRWPHVIGIWPLPNRVNPSANENATLHFKDDPAPSPPTLPPSTSSDWSFLRCRLTKTSSFAVGSPPPPSLPAGQHRLPWKRQPRPRMSNHW